MQECNFCEKKYDESAGGFTVFKRDGTGMHFCSHKCLRNQVMKRSRRKLKWTQAT